MKSCQKVRAKIYCLPALVWLWLISATLHGADAPSTPQAPAPEFSIPAGVYTSNLLVRLGSDAEWIRYTTDGSEPTEKSRQYSKPIKITLSTVIRARSFNRGSAPSDIVCHTYTLAEPDIAGFNSNLPLVIIDAFGQTIERERKIPVSIRINELRGGRCSLTGPSEFDGRATINMRGNTSLRYPKRSFHFKTRDEGGDPLKVALLGMPKDSDWILYAPYPDKTLLRDVLAYELSNDMGRYAPRTRFVEVFVTYGGRLGSQDYMGVYVLEEKVKRGKQRVDVAKLGPDDAKEPEISGGYVFKKDHLDRAGGGMPTPNELGMPDFRRGSMGLRPGFPTGPGGFPARPEGFLRANGGVNFNSDPGQPQPGRSRGRTMQFRVDPATNFAPFIVDSPLLQGYDDTIPNSIGFSTRKGNNFFYVEPKPDEISSRQKTWLKRYVERFERALYGPNFRSPSEGYPAYIDADSFIDHHLLVEATKNIDGFRFSTFYYKDRGGKIKMGPIWDWNLSFGNVNGKQGWLARYWYWPQLDDQQYSWFRRLFQDPDFGQKYVDRWAALRTNVLATSRVLARIDELSRQLSEAQVRNFQRWPIIGRTVWPNHFVGDSYQEEIDFMKNFIETRFAWIDAQFVAAPRLSAPAGSIAPNSKITLSAEGDKEHRIYYTLDGTDPRASVGTPSPSAKAYDGPITLKQGAKLFARTFEENLWSSPTTATTTK